MKGLKRSYYSNTLKTFLEQNTESVLGDLTKNSTFNINEKQRNAWIEQIKILKDQLSSLKDKSGKILFEYTIPRIGKRADNILLYKNLIFVFEFKCGKKEYTRADLDQVYDYGLDLSNFHKESQGRIIIPILICTKASDYDNGDLVLDAQNVVVPLFSNGNNLSKLIEEACAKFSDQSRLDYEDWEESNYYPTPTIIEAAQALFEGNSVEEISRTDAEAINLTATTEEINRIIDWSKKNQQKSICFVAGVPGSGKTLVGLNLSIQHANLDQEKEGAAFLSGNGPLVKVLQEALARDKVKNSKNKIKKDQASREVNTFIQIIHKYRDAYLDPTEIPSEHIVIFDEAQRAWTHKQIKKFMKDKKGLSEFKYSEPEFLIDTMNRRDDWSVIICLIGDGQEINTGEAGLDEWFRSLKRSYPSWNVFAPNLKENQFVSLDQIPDGLKINEKKDLWLSTSLRSFRSTLLSEFVNSLLDVDIKKSQDLFKKLQETYPIYITRDIHLAKKWIKQKTKGSERPGLLGSSSGGRLKSEGIFIKNDINVAEWFLNSKDDFRSSYSLEDVVTEFDIQGLEIDYALVAWDADLRFDINENKWIFKRLWGKDWQNINLPERQKYLINAYRVLLTRARQGMIIYIPEGNSEDSTRKNEFYDGTYSYLKSIGIPEIKNEFFKENNLLPETLRID